MTKSRTKAKSKSGGGKASKRSPKKGAAAKKGGKKDADKKGAKKDSKSKSGSTKTNAAKKKAAKKKAAAKRAAKKPKKVKLTAKNSDRHDLYQRSVQAPDVDAKFYAKQFKKLTGEPLRRFREDFCGTGFLCCHFVKMHPENTAVGVDLDRPTIEWGLKNNMAKLLNDDQRSRVNIIEGDVREISTPQAQAIVASNFSYCCLMTRENLQAYFDNSFRSLEPGGVLFCDSWGGSETQVELEEDRDIDDGAFTYVWDQHKFDPVTYEAECRIHFRFNDGSEKRNAFRYVWRMFTLPEIRETMTAAGFEDVHVLWEGTDKKTNEGSGNYKRVERGEADESWIAYVVGRRPS